MTATGDTSQNIYPPIPAIVDEAWVKDWRTVEASAGRDPIDYWDGRAKELHLVPALDPSAGRQ